MIHELPKGRDGLEAWANHTFVWSSDGWFTSFRRAEMVWKDELFSWSSTCCLYISFCVSAAHHEWKVNWGGWLANCDLHLVVDCSKQSALIWFSAVRRRAHLFHSRLFKAQHIHLILSCSQSSKFIWFSIIQSRAHLFDSQLLKHSAFKTLWKWSEVRKSKVK